MLSGETIHKIMISDNDKEKVFDLLEDETIKSMIEAASETRLKKANDFINLKYTLYLYTNDYNVYTIKIDEDQIYLDDHFYTVVGENGFYQIVEEIHNQQN